MRKILIFSLAYAPLIGGAEVAVKELTDRISHTRFDMVTLRFDRTMPRFERIGNVNVYRVGFVFTKQFEAGLGAFLLKCNKLPLSDQNLLNVVRSPEPHPHI